MDTKALAKSKRAHSLHHNKKPHSIQKSKAQSGGSSGDSGSGNKQLGKQQAKEKAPKPALPSNWDRYEEEFDLDSEELSGDSMKKASDVVLPKSKGADYGYLIAEAQSQSQSNSSLDRFPSLDDSLLGEFKLGIGPMLSVRGEGILSWIGDDNFAVEDETTLNPEIPFLSLNLNALAEQLAKVNLAKRLFIEEDLLPPELTDDHRSTSDSLESDRAQTSATEVKASHSEQLASEDLFEKNKVTDQDTYVASSLPTAHVSDMLNQTKGDLNSRRDSKLSQGRNQVNPISVAIPDKKVSKFEATAAEAELDMLLDSFSETKLLDSPGYLSSTFPRSQKEASTAQSQITRAAPSSSKTTGFDDVLDDLLDSSYQIGKTTATSDEIQTNFTGQSVSKSKVSDDFDSWLDTI